MTIREACLMVRSRLSDAGIAAADFEARQLACHCFGLSGGELLLHGGKEAGTLALTRLARLAEQRAARRPLQYLLGEWSFYGLTFEVGEGVLIPRPDTETLVEEGLTRLKGVSSPAVLDLCAGSGCIAVTIAKHRPDARVDALEKYPAALFYLRKNIARHLTGNVRVLERDLFAGPDGGPYDLILSNPPYIPAGELSDLMPEVRAEPVTALDGGPDGLQFYRVIAGGWSRLLRPGGWLLAEVGMGQHEAVAGLFAEAGLCGIGLIKDIGGICRVVCGRAAPAEP